MPYVRHILLLRHGMTDSNAGGVIQGHLPVPLNAAGREQAVHLAQRIRAWTPAVDQLISSDLARAMQTAEPIARALGLPIESDPAWRERCLGEMEGKTVGEAGIWRAATSDDTPPGAETRDEFAHRIRTALLALHHRGGKVMAVVTHGGCCRNVLRMFAEGWLELEAGEKVEEPPIIANCSILHLTARTDGSGVRYRVECINDTDHLPQIESADAG